MLDCPKCGSERIFGGRCLDCGFVLGDLPHLGETGTFAPTREGALPEAHAEPGLAFSGDFKADHVVTFEVPKSLKKLQPHRGAAALNQPTVFSMVKAVKKGADGTAQTTAGAAPKVASQAKLPAFEWPSLQDVARDAGPRGGGTADLLESATGRPQPTPTPRVELAVPSAEDSAIQALAAPLEPEPVVLAPLPSLTAPTPPPSLTAPTPPPPDLPESHALNADPPAKKGRPHAQPNKQTFENDAALDLDFDAYSDDHKVNRESFQPSGPKRELGVVPDQEILGRYSGTLMREGAPLPTGAATGRGPGPRPSRPTKGRSAKTWAAVGLGLVLIGAFFVLERASAQTKTLEFADKAVSVLHFDNFDPESQTLNGPLLEHHIKTFCFNSEVDCQNLKVWVRPATKQAWATYHGEAFPYAESKPSSRYVIAEVGFKTTVHAKGWLYTRAHVDVEARYVDAISSDAVKFGP